MASKSQDRGFPFFSITAMRMHVIVLVCLEQAMLWNGPANPMRRCFSPGDLAVTFKTDNPITGNVNNADVLFRRDLAEGWTSADPGVQARRPGQFQYCGDP